MKYVATFLVLLGTWLLLSNFTSIDELIVGAIVACLLTILIAKNVNYTLDWLFPVKLIVFIIVYIPLFLYKLILANFDVARRVLSIKIPLNPGIVKVETKLKGDFGKLTLANSITLTPGTLSLDAVDDYLYIHCIDCPKQGNESSISRAFEKILGVIFK